LVFSKAFRTTSAGCHANRIKKYKTMTKKLFLKAVLLLMCCPAMLSCNSDDDTKNASIPYEQYGEPFANMPAKEDAIIYQVNVRSFGPSGKISEVTSRLDYIQSLGANVVYLMPIYPVGTIGAAGADGSPYAVKDYKAIATEMGTLEDLRALVAAAHSRNMAVMMDWVANHTAIDNAWVNQHPDWYQHNPDTGAFIPPPNTNWTDVYQLEHDNPELLAAMADAMQYWVRNANIDGFRCDAADFVGPHFWDQLLPMVRKAKKQDMLFLAEGSKVSHFQAGFDYTFGFGFFSALESVYGENQPATKLQDVNATEYYANYNSENRIVRYTTNHDVNLSDGTAIELFKGNKGSIAAFVVASYMKSVPMIYNAQEVGYNTRINYFDNQPIDWSNPNNEMLEEYKKIIGFRKTSAAVKTGTFTGYSSASVSAFTMIKGDEKVLIIVNLTNAATNYIMPAPLAATSWNDAFTGSAANVGNNISLQPFQYLILKN
jgi:glycosidase